MGSILKIDIDIPYETFIKELKGEFIETRKRILDYYGLKIVNFQVKKSSKNTHVILEVNKDLPLREIFKLQYICGDDPHRYMYNKMRIEWFGEEKAKYFNILFTKKTKVR